MRRMAAAGVLLVGLVGAGVLVAGAPAAAQEDQVRLRVSSGFTAGGRAGTANLAANRRGPGCVPVRTELSIGLPGLTPEQVLVQVDAGRGQLRTVTAVSGGDGLVVAQRIVPDRAELCPRRGVAVRYRVTFLATAPAGRAAFVGEVFTADGRSLGADTDQARVASRNGPASPTRSATPTPTPTPSPTPEPTEPGGAEPTPATSPVAGGVAGPVAEESGWFGLSTVVMIFGVVLVGVGAALIVLLVRRGRAHDDGTTQVLPRVPR
jgi:hypothetical protein